MRVQMYIYYKYILQLSWISHKQIPKQKKKKQSFSGKLIFDLSKSKIIKCELFLNV